MQAPGQPVSHRQPASRHGGATARRQSQQGTRSTSRRTATATSSERAAARSCCSSKDAKRTASTIRSRTTAVKSRSGAPRIARPSHVATHPPAHARRSPPFPQILLSSVALFSHQEPLGRAESKTPPFGGGSHPLPELARCECATHDRRRGQAYRKPSPGIKPTRKGNESCSTTQAGARF